MIIFIVISSCISVVAEEMMREGFLRLIQTREILEKERKRHGEEIMLFRPSWIFNVEWIAVVFSPLLAFPSPKLPISLALSIHSILATRLFFCRLKQRLYSFLQSSALIVMQNWFFHKILFSALLRLAWIHYKRVLQQFWYPQEVFSTALISILLPTLCVAMSGPCYLLFLCLPAPCFIHMIRCRDSCIIRMTFSCSWYHETLCQHGFSNGVNIPSRLVYSN